MCIGADESLLHADDATKGGKYRFRAPVAASTQADPLHIGRHPRFAFAKLPEVSASDLWQSSKV